MADLDKNKKVAKDLNRELSVIENTFLDNEKWRIVEMATAHGMFTIEIEIEN